jgi:hypothetical protein
MLRVVSIRLRHPFLLLTPISLKVLNSKDRTHL